MLFDLCSQAIKFAISGLADFLAEQAADCFCGHILNDFQVFEG